MTRPISLVHLESSPHAADRLTHALEDDPLAVRITVVRDAGAFHTALRAGGADVAVCSIGSPCSAAAAAVRGARRTAPDVPVIALLDCEDPAVELDVLASGAVDCLSPSRTGRFGWALRRAMAQRDESSRREHVQTEIANLEAQLHHAQRLTNIARLAGGVAHDFNNLLTIINGCCQFLLRTLPPGHELRPLVEPIEQAGARGAELTRKLLAFSRPEPVSATLVKLNDVITDAQPILAPLLGETVRLALHLDPALWLIRADMGEVSQVLMNLVTNARDAMPEGGTVTIRTSNVDQFGASGSAGSGSYVELVVRDGGCGMTDDVRARIFDAFFTTKPKGQGTGLGLATVHRIVTQLQGDIDVETAPGRGTTVRVRFPRAIPPGDVKGPVVAEEPAPAGNETVLVVEDEPGVRAVICGFLRGVGYRVLEAPDAEAATSLGGDELKTVDLLITDVVLPGLSGPRLAAALTERRPGLKTIFVSGYPADALIGTGIEGATGFLPKPFSREVLLQRVRRILETREDAGR